MEIIVFLLLIWLFARIFRRKTKAPLDKWEAYEQAANKAEKLQKRYDELMMSLPELAGDGSYSQRVRGELAYRDTLDSFIEWLDRYHPWENEINVMLERIEGKKGSEHAVRLEAGNAVIGFIPREDAGAFGDELKALGGSARASGRLVRNSDGTNTLSVDVIRPLHVVDKENS
jgi:hypothetical protein